MRYQPVPDPVTGEPYLPVTARGRALLKDSILNKGTGFTDAERHALGIAGLLPRHVSTLAEQVDRGLEQLAEKENDLQRHIYLAGLQDRNETLFYRLILDHLETTVPIIYTPTVAEACRHWSRIFRRARGLYITPDDRGDLDRVLQNYGGTDMAVIVVTDNERILGIGDQGAGGMGIPIGKLALYTAAAGIHPSQCLPISLDVGTDNESLLDDPLYLGYQAPRLRGEPYWALVDELVVSIKRVFPDALLQWEDFGNSTSFRHLDTYRSELPSFNDDIQGTAAMVVAGLFAAMRRLGGRLGDQRLVVAGAGSAGVGIVRQVRTAMVREGLSEDEARSRILVTDSKGLVVAGDAQSVGVKAEVATDPARLSGWTGDAVDLATVIERHRPSILVGVTGQPGTFTRDMIATMAAHHERPIVMPLSNPTTFAEATPTELLAWSDGRAIVATGSPFPPVIHRDTRHVIGQANNMFIFPGMGLGVVASRAREITTGMFLAAAAALADIVNDATLASGSLYPAITEVRSVSRVVALAVVEEAVRVGLADPLEDPEGTIDRTMWFPEYVPYRPA